MSTFEQKLARANRDFALFSITLNFGCLVAGALLVIVAQAVLS